MSGLLVISAGFGEAGPEGSARQAALLAIAGEFGMRIIGPNSLGILNASPRARLNATFGDTLSDIPACESGVAVLAQSGALGIAVLDRALDMGLGVSRFVSLGAHAILHSLSLRAQWSLPCRSREGWLIKLCRHNRKLLLCKRVLLLCDLAIV